MDKLPNKHGQEYVEIDGQIIYIEDPEAEKSIEYGVSNPEVVQGKEYYEVNYTPEYNAYPAPDMQDPYVHHMPNPIAAPPGPNPQSLQQNPGLYNQVPMPNPQGINNAPVYNNQAFNPPHNYNGNNQANPPNPPYNQPQPFNVNPQNPHYNQPANVYPPNLAHNLPQQPYAYYPGANPANNPQPIVYAPNIIPATANIAAGEEPLALDANLSIICKNSVICRYLALGNIIADLLFVISIVFLFFLLGLNILGYFGARLVRRWMCAGYCVYLLISGLLKLIILVVYPYPYIIVIYLILLGYEGYVLFMYVKFFRSIRYLDDHTCSRISHYAMKKRLIKCLKV